MIKVHIDGLERGWHRNLDSWRRKGRGGREKAEERIEGDEKL